jgi:hypothetical protein
MDFNFSSSMFDGDDGNLKGRKINIDFFYFIRKVKG